jgi:hypothetical protein
MNTRLSRIESKLRLANESLTQVKLTDRIKPTLDSLKGVVYDENIRFTDNQDEFAIVHDLAMTMAPFSIFAEQDIEATALLGQAKSDVKVMRDACDPYLNPSNPQAVAACQEAQRSADRSNDKVGKLLRGYRTNISSGSYRELEYRQAIIEKMKRWTYVLFVVGWFLGLIGKVWKSPTLGEIVE